MLIIPKQGAICTTVFLVIDLESSFKKLSRQSAGAQQTNARDAPEGKGFCTKPPPAQEGTSGMVRAKT